MISDDIRARIAALERDNERIVETIETCRKAMVIAKAAMLTGAAAFSADIFNLIRLPAAIVLASIAAIIGGIVFYGASRSTRLEAEQKAKSHDIERARLIDMLDLHDSHTTLH